MYAFSGWNAATYITGELRDAAAQPAARAARRHPDRTVLYVALNAVFLATTPLAAMAGQLDVARIAGAAIFGDTGGRIVAAMICLGLVSSISAMMWIGPRVTMTMGEDVPALRRFAQRPRPVRRAPRSCSSSRSRPAASDSSFEAVLDFIQFALLICAFFAVLGVIKLRIMRPELPRPYRAWGYPVTPVVFLLVTAFMMLYLVVERPLQSLLSVLILLAGLGGLCRGPRANRLGPSAAHPGH